MAETVQKNFRMSTRAIKLLHSVARARGMTETEVVETCVAKYAIEIGQDVDRAKELLFRQICGAAAKSPGGGSATGRDSITGGGSTTGQRVAAPGESSALNEESRHGGKAREQTPPPALPHPDLEKAVHAAEGIVETARKRGGSKGR